MPLYLLDSFLLTDSVTVSTAYRGRAGGEDDRPSKRCSGNRGIKEHGKKEGEGIPLGVLSRCH